MPARRGPGGSPHPAGFRGDAPIGRVYPGFLGHRGGLDPAVTPGWGTGESGVTGWAGNPRLSPPRRASAGPDGGAKRGSRRDVGAPHPTPSARVMLARGEERSEETSRSKEPSSHRASTASAPPAPSAPRRGAAQPNPPSGPQQQKTHPRVRQILPWHHPQPRGGKASGASQRGAPAPRLRARPPPSPPALRAGTRVWIRPLSRVACVQRRVPPAQHRRAPLPSRSSRRLASPPSF